MSYAICTWPTARFASLGQTIMESCASSLTMSPPVKHFLGGLTRALRRERHFALVEGVPYQPQGSLVIGFRSETQFDPCISSVTTSRTELVYLLVIPSFPHHPIHPNRESAGHRDLGDLPPPPHRQVEILTAPFWEAAYCDLGRFH